MRDGSDFVADRFWIERGHSPTFDADGFLRDPTISNDSLFFSAPVSSSEELRELRAIVLLGEMGMGKTKEMKRAEILVPSVNETLFTDLAGYGSEDRFVQEVLRSPAIEAWKSGTSTIAVVWDGFDEAKTRIEHLGTLIADELDRWPLDRMVIRIASRPADWSTPLEDKLAEGFGECQVFNLLPLRQEDARKIAGRYCADADGFMEAVDKAKAAPLASRPQTLELLAKIFDRDGSLQQRTIDLYRQGTLAIFEEDNAKRRDAGMTGLCTSAERAAIAGRIASAMIFGGATALWSGPTAKAPPDSVAKSKLVGDTEVLHTGSGTVEVTEDRLADTYASGIFTASGQDLSTFAHITFRNYLAASWIATNLTDAQVRSLLVSPSGRVWSQYRPVVAWLVALDTDRFGWIAHEDPESLSGEVELPGDEIRQAVVQGLFGMVEKTDGLQYRRFTGLSYPGLEALLRHHVDGDSWVHRALAVSLAVENRVLGLEPEIRALAHDVENGSARGFYADKLLELVDAPYSGLRSLPELQLDSDPARHLPRMLALGLRTSWPHKISTTEVFALLSPDFFTDDLADWEFASDFGDSLAPSNLDLALEWVEDNLELLAGSSGSPLCHLANAILSLSLDHLEVDDVRIAVAIVIIHRSASLCPPLFNTSYPNPTSNVEVTAGRLDLVHEILTLVDPGSWLGFLTRDGPCWLDLVTVNDLPHLADQAMEHSGPLGERYADLMNLLVDVNNPGFFLNLPVEHKFVERHPENYSVDLDSELAIHARTNHQINQEDSRRVAEADARIDRDLADIAAGNGDGFFALLESLSVPPGKSSPGDFLKSPVKQDRWTSLSGQQRSAILEAAESYLRGHDCGADDWVDRAGNLHPPAQAGYLAFCVLLAAGPSMEVDAELSRKWAPAVVAAFSGNDWVEKETVMQLLDEHAHEQMVTVLLRRVQASANDGKSFKLRHETWFLYDEAVDAALTEHLQVASEPLLGELLDIVVKAKPHDASALLLGLLAKSDETDQRSLVAAGRLAHLDLAGHWSSISPWIENRTDGGEAFFCELASGESVAHERLPEWLIAELLKVLEGPFPYGEDPDIFVEPYSPRHRVAEFRNKLYRQLRFRGTVESLDALQKVREWHPHPLFVTRFITDAKESLSSRRWSPVEPEHLRRLADDANSVLVTDMTGLVALSRSLFEQIQNQLTGATPESHLLWDTESKRPKAEDEVSDYLKNELVKLAQGHKMVVNREVEVRRNQPNGFGESIDLLVQAHAGETDEFFSLPVEVKGAWHPKLLTAMEEQLLDRYMADLGAEHGVYLVLWPDLPRWEDTGHAGRKRIENMDEDDIRLQLQEQAQSLADGRGVSIEVVHLRMDYLRAPVVSDPFGCR